jgi:hypothetical protein
MAAEFRRVQDDRESVPSGSLPSRPEFFDVLDTVRLLPYSLQSSLCASANASESPAKEISTTMSGDAPTAGIDSLCADCFINCGGATVIDAANGSLRQLILCGAGYDQPSRSQLYSQRRGLMHYANWNRLISQSTSNQSR